jgi:branched-chain amino acid transport system substrate-binding protein
MMIPQVDGFIAYLTLLNERDGGINSVKLVWEECETVFDVDRTVECYERLKARGPTGAVVMINRGTATTYALTEGATHDKIPLFAVGYGRADAADGRVFPVCLQPPGQLVESEYDQDPLHRSTGWRHGAAQGPENRPCPQG